MQRDVARGLFGSDVGLPWRSMCVNCLHRWVPPSPSFLKIALGALSSSAHWHVHSAVGK